MPEGWIHHQLSFGSCLLLVDGVDELTEDERTKVREWLNLLLRTYPDTPMMVTSRLLAAAPDWLSSEGFTLAVNCKDSVSDLPPKLLQKMSSVMHSLTPPKSKAQAVEMAELGEPIIEYLPQSPEGMTAEQVAPRITTAALVGGDESIDLLANYAAHQRADIHALLFKYWHFFDSEQYSREILQLFSLPGATITITDPSQLEHLAHREYTASVEVGLTGHDISVLKILNDFPRVDQVRVKTNGTTDLEPLRTHRDLLRLTITNADRLENVDALEKLTNLYQLDINNAPPLDDISFIGQLPGLEGLSLGKLTHVEDYSPLRNLENLRWLNLQSCPRTGDFHDIAHLGKITKLELTECTHPETTTAVARCFPNLRSLVLDGAKPVSLEPLAPSPWRT